MKKNQFKRKTLSGILATFVGSIILASCGQAATNNEIIFSLAQSEVYPLVQVLKGMVQEYNTTQNQQAGFLPVKLDTADTSKITSESDLLNRTTTSIAAGDINNTPNLILNTPYAAAPINAYNRLLNINDIFKVSDFASKIIAPYTKIAGVAATDRLYALPFDSSSTETLAFNLPVMKAIFDAMKTAGATVTKGTDTNSITKKIEDAKVDELPTNSPWKNVQGKSGALNSTTTRAESTAKYTISDETFKTYDKITEFAQKAKKALTLKSDAQGNAANPVHVLSVDYGHNMLNRLLWADTGYKQDSYIYQYKNDGGVDYKFLNDSTLKGKFTTSWNKFIKHTNPGLSSTNNTNEKQLAVNGVYYTTNKNDWASWDLRTFKTGMAIAPTVGIPQSVQSPISKAFFASRGKDESTNNTTFNNFAKYGTQVVWTNQVMKMDSSSSDVYVLGGSSLVPIATTTARDQATKKFLTWLYSSESLQKIEAGSGYFVPMATDTQDSTKIDAKITKLKTLQGTESVKNTNPYYYYESVITSLKDLKAMYTSQDTEANKGKELLFNPAGDLNTASLNSRLSEIIKNITQANGTVTTAQNVLEELAKVPLS